MADLNTENRVEPETVDGGYGSVGANDGVWPTEKKSNTGKLFAIVVILIVAAAVVYALA